MHSLHLSQGCSNNKTKYKALIVGLELDLELPVETLTIYGDFELSIRQMNELYHIKKLSLTPYLKKAKELEKLFRGLYIRHVKKGYNSQADALASLATSLTHSTGNYITIHIGERRVIPLLSNDEDSGIVYDIKLQMLQENIQNDVEHKILGKDWCILILKYLLDRREPSDPVLYAKIRFKQLLSSMVNFDPHNFP